jgi:hypothetical protein
MLMSHIIKSSFLLRVAINAEIQVIRHMIITKYFIDLIERNLNSVEAFRKKRIFFTKLNLKFPKI